MTYATLPIPMHPGSRTASGAGVIGAAALKSAAGGDLLSDARGPRPPTQHDQLVNAARKWVAQTFYGTLLRQMRNSPFKSELFSGGRGGEAYSALLDQQLAQHMAGSTGDKLVRSIVKKIEGRRAYARVHQNRAPAGAANEVRIDVQASR